MTSFSGLNGIVLGFALLSLTPARADQRLEAQQFASRLLLESGMDAQMLDAKDVANIADAGWITPNRVVGTVSLIKGEPGDTEVPVGLLKSFVDQNHCDDSLSSASTKNKTGAAVLRMFMSCESKGKASWRRNDSCGADKF